MKAAILHSPSYLACFAAQIGALGAAGQRRLQHASVLVAGAGGLGTMISSILATAGVGKLVIVDPQRVEPENFNRYAFARVTDIGKPKVDVVAAFFEGRPHLTVVPIFSRAEASEVERAAQGIQLVVAASNTLSSRLALARFAATRQLPQISAAVTDCREARGGCVAAWVPERSDWACPACFLRPNSRVGRGESVLTSVVSVVGALAASLALEMLVAAHRASALAAGNYLTIDLTKNEIELLTVLSRPDCERCSNAGRRETRNADERA